MWSGVAFQPDTTNHSPNVPAPHNSPVWNSTNPISATAVSTGRPHSWAYHWPKIRPFWLLCCMPVITHKKMLIPTDSPPHGLMAPLLCPHALQLKHLLSDGPLTSSLTTEGSLWLRPRIAAKFATSKVQHSDFSSFTRRSKYDGIYALYDKWDFKIDWDFMSSRALLWFDV